MKKELDVTYVGSDDSFVDLVQEYIHTASDNINISGFTNITEAIEHIHSTNADCVISDYDLNTQRHRINNGLGLLDRISDKNPDIPFILFTHDNGQNVGTKAIENGATDYIQKQTIIDSHELIVNRIENAHKTAESKRRLKRINSVSTKLATETDVNEIGRITISAAREVMGYKFVGFHIAKEGVGMVPIEYTDPVEELLGPPTITDRESIAWEAFESNETIEHEDVRDADNVLDEETPIRSEISIPLGKYGVLLVGSTDVDGFSDTDISSLELVAENAVEALRRREKRKELERFKLFVENSPDTIQIVSADGVIKYQNIENPQRKRATPKISELDKITEHVHPDYEQKVLSDIEAAKQADDEIIRTQYKSKDKQGEWKWFESQVKNYLDNEVINGFIRTTREITEQKETQHQLEQKNEQLDQFNSVVCHDLKNPLAAIKANIEMLQYKTEDDELRKYIDDADKKADRMEQLINDMLELAKSGESLTDVSEVSIHTAATDAWDTITQKEASLDINITEDVTVRSDKSRLQQLFENLFKNAIKHGGEDVTITIGELTNGFYVKDDGEGISPKVENEIFEGGVTTEDDGTGYGLKIVSQIISAHNWNIDIDHSASGAKFDIKNVDSLTAMSTEQQVA